MDDGSPSNKGLCKEKVNQELLDEVFHYFH